MLSLTIILFSILASSLLMREVSRLIKFPQVIGEILGGLLLGPTVLAIFFPEIFENHFMLKADQKPALDAVYNLGLIILMFISGMETKTSYKSKERAIVSYLLAGTLVAFVLGFFAMNFYGYQPIIGVKGDLFSLKLVFAIAVSVTSIPVISRIFLDLNLLHTKFSTTVITTATIQDMVLWIMLATLTNKFSSLYSNIIQVLVVTPLLLFGILFVLPRLSVLLKNRKTPVNKNFLFLVLIQSFYIIGVIVYLFNTNKILSAFLAGVIVNNLFGLKLTTFKKYLKKIALNSFIPLYFGIVGYKLNLIHNFDFYYFIGFLTMSSFIKIFCIYVCSIFLKFNMKTSMNFSIAMNTRGGPGIVLATIAFDAGIINEIFFTTLVITSIITSLISGYWFYFISERETKNNEVPLQITTK
ncbi:cation:proton antiporter [[Flexibacter] sp. ATCC 35103]|uniref:cation:proton antiporter n=1 Tax=[Flexibacter] sp. ATCC 35103 TaxID=1937528 RepID=UPI0009F9E860|nr:cation:proton antiporter [[Flexibacter] sp. ATCC 35103]